MACSLWVSITSSNLFCYSKYKRRLFVCLAGCLLIQMDFVSRFAREIELTSNSSGGDGGGSNRTMVTLASLAATIPTTKTATTVATIATIRSRRRNNASDFARSYQCLKIKTEWWQKTNIDTGSIMIWNSIPISLSRYLSVDYVTDIFKTIDWLLLLLLSLASDQFLTSQMAIFLLFLSSHGLNIGLNAFDKWIESDQQVSNFPSFKSHTNRSS